MASCSAVLPTDSLDSWPSPLRLLYLGSLGSSCKGAKPQYLHQHFAEVTIPELKHSSYAAAKKALEAAVLRLSPDVVVAHGSAVAKAAALVGAGSWNGPLVVLAGGAGCSSLSECTSQAVTVVVPTRSLDSKSQREALRLFKNTSCISIIEVDDVADLNTSLVGKDRLRHIIVETVVRHRRSDLKEQARWLLSESALNQDGLLSTRDLGAALESLPESVRSNSHSMCASLASASATEFLDIDDVVEELFPPMVSGAAVAMPDSVEEASPDDFIAVDEGSDPEQVVCEQEAEQAEQDAVAAAPASLAVNASAAPAGGQLFTWGRGSDGQLGQDKVAHPKPNCALPHPIPGFKSVTFVACGGGQQGCTGAVTAAGELFTFGNNSKGRLGHGEGPCDREPRRVDALCPEFVIAVAFGSDHGAALCIPRASSEAGGSDRRLWLWGGNGHGQLGRGHAQNSPDSLVPAAVDLLAVKQIDCEDQYSAAVLEDGRVFTWGSDAHGRLGIGGRGDQCKPAEVKVPVAAASVSLGSLYAGAVGVNGALFMWGYGGHGNLGLGSRKSTNTPVQVELPEPAAQVACTRGQEGCKGGLNPTGGGQEGPHTVVLAQSGALYTMGTCHKGLLCNLGSKDGAFGKPWDELKPYRVGGPIRNSSNDAPMSPLAVWPPPYDAIGPQMQVASGHIHAACVGQDGRAWAWGCGSNDGRCGVERFLNMKGEGRPPTTDMMKCYMMGPHRIGIARPLYWKHDSLRGYRVLQIATGRNHMAAIALRDGSVASA